MVSKTLHYQKFYKQLRNDKSEEYISDVYNKMLENKENKKLFYEISEDTIILGTPEEYEAWLKNGK